MKEEGKGELHGVSRYLELERQGDFTMMKDQDVLAAQRRSDYPLAGWALDNQAESCSRLLSTSRPAVVDHWGELGRVSDTCDTLGPACEQGQHSPKKTRDLFEPLFDMLQALCTRSFTAAGLATSGVTSNSPRRVFDDATHLSPGVGAAVQPIVRGRSISADAVRRRLLPVNASLA